MLGMLPHNRQAPNLFLAEEAPPGGLERDDHILQRQGRCRGRQIVLRQAATGPSLHSVHVQQQARKLQCQLAAERAVHTRESHSMLVCWDSVARKSSWAAPSASSPWGMAVPSRKRRAV